MNKVKIMPLFEMTGEGGGAGTSESFDFEAIKGHRASIAGQLEAAVGALNEGTKIIEGNFGSAGGAMSGGSSNAIKNKWEELAKTIKAFSSYLDNTLDNIKAVGVSNEALEAEAKALFATTDHFATQSGGGSTTNTYTNMVR